MRIIITLLFLISFFPGFSQLDPLYSQYQFNQLMINPAYAGIYSRVSAGLITRFQWAGIAGAPQTNTITAQAGLADGRIGLGGVVLNDQFGVSSNYEVQFSGSYNINFFKSRLAMGIQGGLIQYGYDFSNVEFDFLDDPEIVNGHQNISQPNFGVGFMYMRETFFIGASIPRILSISVTDGMTTSERYRKHYYLTTGFVKEINRVPFKFLGLVRCMDSETLSADLTFSALLDDALWAGVTLRDLQHFGLLAIIDVSKNLQVGYSFEMPSNSLIYGNYGTHEVSLQLNIKSKQRPLFEEKYF